MPYVGLDMTIYEAIQIAKQATASTNTGVVVNQVYSPKQSTADAQADELVGKIGPAVGAYDAEEANRLIQDY